MRTKLINFIALTALIVGFSPLVQAADQNSKPKNQSQKEIDRQRFEELSNTSGYNTVNNNGVPIPNILEHHLEDLYTDQLIVTKKIPNLRGKLILFAGLGAKSKDYGVGATFSSTASSMMKLGIEVTAFQNPIYFRDYLPDEERLELVKPFAKVDNLIRWMAQVVRKAISETPPGIPIALGGRSFGSALLYELLHRYVEYGEYKDIFERINDIIPMGTVDHRPEQFQLWHTYQEVYLKRERPEVRDEVASQLEIEIFKEFKYAQPILKEQPNLNMPEIHHIIGIWDEVLRELTVQIELARHLAQIYPNAKFHVRILDTKHNPGSSVAYKDESGETIVVKEMERFKPILLDIFDPNRKPQVEHYVEDVIPQAQFEYNKCIQLLTHKSDQ